jgi:ADP-ribosyl-[dinitrogen reductase] hydrolase
MLHQMMYGSILGALIGDAWGSSLEFYSRKITREDVLEAKKLLGGGVFGLAPGQYTDDGEMIAALLNAIHWNQGKYDVEVVAQAYRQWFLSSPFDMGTTIRRALNIDAQPSIALSDSMIERANRLNSESLSNGCLMRATPLGIVAAKLSLEETLQMVAQDVRLTHPHPACVHATTAYVIALRALYLNPADYMVIFQEVSEYLALNSLEVEEWFQDALDGYLPSVKNPKGHIKIPFSYAMYYLYHEYDIESALEELLLCGGDTDTNACIVGGLLGAHCGLHGLPVTMLRMLARCNTKKGLQKRPEMYSYKSVMRSLSHITGKNLS